MLNTVLNVVSDILFSIQGRTSVRRGGLARAKSAGVEGCIGMLELTKNK
jgi:hypothetical protein